jgi:uncharacterized RDD family membrane protein YckC
MTQNPKFASFWPRLTAYVLDSLIMGLPFAFIVIPIIGSLTLDTQVLKEQIETKNLQQYYALYSGLVISAIACLVVWAGLLALITCSKWQATPGKRIMALYVTTAEGEKPKFLQCFLRYAALPLVILTIQTPERFYIYENLQALAQNSEATETDLQQSFSTPISSFIGLLSLFVICVWYGLIAMRPEKTAGHDILFNTRVVNGRT